MGSDKSDFKTVMEKVGIPTNILKKRPKNYKRKFVPNKPEPTEPDPGEGVYRNRALERSQLKEEYRKVQEEYELFKKQTEEESRYMGGDEEHTHLVKGLDYKLLEKVKRQLETTASDSKDVRESKEDRDFCFTEFGFYFYKKFFYHTNLNNVNFNRKLDQTIDLLSKGYKFKANKILNLTYNFNLSNEDLPSIIINDNSTHSSGNLLTNNLELKKELIEAFNWHAENRKKKKSERLPFRPTTATNEQEKEEDSEDDIYQNIEKYKPDEFDEEIITSISGNKEKEGEEYKSRGLTYKIPEKLLKRSKFVQKQEENFQSDIDMEDSDEEIDRNKEFKVI
ncbi:uncharacterized protein TOT_030000838 [Theileria orientalis strain Shintoku]|uniref:RED-like N-terminal domain-containing protein n=1 Tax=Theileria orientalis strain Shintoku TaxID=869250 RepID=J4D9S9_THEOR|nr:uncharacterized protein TOT_030000838 [Theileria orientalis strain Shintoku]BAM41575.1 uncharacterized protein TOT_030000838 [Theileria orientalis strain Shintoku]|eukprot:XP_009691876.1 uncharacterized protein TOT_030000838 [Theileria orientalis strain Shintoku]